MMPDAVYKIRARWTRNGGGRAVWNDKGELLVCFGPFGAYRRRGRPRSFAAATRLLRKLGGEWHSCHGDEPARLPPAPREVSVESLSGCVEMGGLWVQQAEPPPSPARLARVAAYALRQKAQTVRLASPACSLFDEPLTLGEVAAALTDPAAPLSEAERVAATEAMFGEPSDDAEDGGDEGDDD